MSISQETISLIHTVKQHINKEWNSFSLCELGNQNYFDVDGTKKSFKIVYESWGGKHTSIDLNGKDGSLICDLTKDISKWEHSNLKHSFDIVTNFGTSEHCFNQKQVFKNIHNLLKPTGYIIHAVPLNGYWKNHSPYKYTKEFLTDLSKLNSYQIIHISERQRRSNFLLCGILYKQQDSEFKWNDNIKGLFEYNDFTNKGHDHYL